MNFTVNINANKEKAIKESDTVNSSSKNHSRNYSNRQNKAVKSVQTVSSDTPCVTLNDLLECLNHPKKVIIGHPNIICMRNKLSSFKDLVFNETGICLLSETKNG